MLLLFNGDLSRKGALSNHCSSWTGSTRPSPHLTNIASGVPVAKCLQPDGKGGSITVYRVNPNAIELRLKLFIPSPVAQVKILGIPTLLSYGGDNRSFSYNGSTFRSIQSVVIDPTKANPQSLAFGTIKNQQSITLLMYNRSQVNQTGGMRLNLGHNRLND